MGSLPQDPRPSRRASVSPVNRSGRYGAGREAILDATAELIRTKGVAGTSISDIVQASGTSAGAIYHSFSSKQDIVLAVSLRAIDQPVTIALAATGSVSPAELFALAAERVAAEPTTSAMLVQIWAGAAADAKLRDLLATHGEGFYAGVAAHVTEWCDARGLDATEVAQAVVGAVIGLAVQGSVFGDFDRRAYVNQVGRLLDRLA